MAQRIDRDVDLGALAPLGPVIAGPRTRLRRGLQGSAVDADRRRLALAPGPLADDRLHVTHQRLKYACGQPPPELLVHRVPRRKIVRDPAPLTSRPGHITHTVEHRSKIMLPLPSILTAQQQIRQNKPPLLIRHVRRIPNAHLAHPSMLNKHHTPAKNLRRYKVHNRL